MKNLCVAASTLAVILAACGGGGGDSTTAAVTTPAATVTAVSGFASKGMIRQAKVLVCRVANGSPETDSSCAVGSTDRNGFYNVSLSDGYAGPAMVKIVPARGSVMTDETTGTDVPYTMTMRALVPAVGSGITVHVTPFSEMAASAMMLSLPIDAIKMHQAITALQDAMTNLGINLDAMPMMDLQNDASNTAALGNQANMLKQLARVAMMAKNSDFPTDSNGNPCNAAGTTASQEFACTVQAMAHVMTSYVSHDATKMADLMAAMSAQSVTAVTMPVRNLDGSISIQTVDMTSLASMQTVMQSGGMTATSAATMANAAMGGMH